MLAFLARLTPGARAAAASGVRAALPARFAPREAADGLREEALEVSADRGPGPAAMQAPVSFDASALPPVDTLQPAALQPLNMRIAEATSAAPIPRAPAPSAAHADTPLEGVTPARGEAFRPDAPARADRGPPPVVKAALARLPHDDATALPADRPARTRSAPDARPALSAATLAQRAAAERAAAPTVVHVTIDRVDVRAPAAPAPPHRPAERRRAGATISLDDYLRQRAKAPRGGAGS